jgi:nicotinamidase-related amidase
MLPVAGTVPYPWPFDADAGVEPHRFALVVTGAQRRWTTLDAGGVAARIEQLAGRVRAGGGTVVLLRHARPPHARTEAILPVGGTPDWELAVLAESDDVVVDVVGHDGFLTGTVDLELRARGCDHLLFAGFASEALLDSTLRSANDRGYECLTISDAVAPFDAAVGARALTSITMSGGIFGAVGTTAAVLDALGVPVPRGAS